MPYPVHEARADHPTRVADKIAKKLLADRPPRSGQLILVKPNIVNPSPPPVTTDVRVVEGIVTALLDTGFERIVVAEGSGTGDTIENFSLLGYERLGAALMDLDAGPSSPVSVAGAEVWSEIRLPDILRDAFIISVPVLKDHSMLGVTLGLKNMVGVLPSSHYSGYWTYKKSQIHRQNPHGCVADLIRLVRPAWVIVDGTIGLRESHIHGTPMDPPANVIFGSADALEADRHGAQLLGHNWEDIGYLRKIASFW